MERIQQTELLDAAYIEPHALEENLRDLERLNRLFGGTALLLRSLGPLLADRSADTPIRILDAGTGSGDTPRALLRWARRRGLDLRITACDLHPQIADYARRCCAAEPAIHVLQADLTRLPFAPGAFDFAVCSLLLHHLSEPQVCMAFAELRRVACHGVIVSDLLRSRAAYAGVTLATRLLSRNRLTRHDGPLSVRRAFTVEELRRLARKAGCPELALRACPGFRVMGVGPGCLPAQAATRAGTRRDRDFAVQTAAR